MKRIVRSVLFVIIAICAGGVPRVHAQTDYANKTATDHLTAGLGFAAGATLHLQAREGTKLGPLFAYRITADLGYPLGGVARANLSLGLDSRGIKERNPDNTEIYTKTRLTYFTITPAIGLSALWVGVNFALPMSGSYSQKNGPTDAERSSDMPDDVFDKVEVLIEPRIGAVVPLMNDKNGFLGLTITGGISFNEIYDRGDIVNSGIDAIGDFHITGAHLGLTYQFPIPGTAR